MGDMLHAVNEFTTTTTTTTTTTMGDIRQQRIDCAHDRFFSSQLLTLLLESLHLVCYNVGLRDVVLS